MDRKETFLGLQHHPWLGKSYAKLNGDDVALCLRFIDENRALDKSEFELKVNRMFLDRTDKPKNHARILELLTCANTTWIPTSITMRDNG